MTIRFRHLLLAALTALCLSAAPAGAAPAREVLRIGMTQYPSTLHPLFDSMLAKSIVLGATLRPMTAYDPQWQPQCFLCTELPSYANGRAKKVKLKNGKTGIAARYTLKPDLFWDDGTPVTTKDVLFAYAVGRDPKSGVSNASLFAEDIDHIDALDDKTFVITFAKEACEFASIDDFYPLPAHLEKEIFDKDPATYQNRSLYATAPETKGLWLGPYRVAKTESGARIVLQRNPDWHGTPPAFARLEFRTIENTSAMASNLLSHQIDYITGELGLPLDQAIGFEKRLPAGAYRVIYKPGLTYEHIDLPLDVAPFDDLRVRQALLLAMNRAAMNDYIFGGRQAPALSNINPLDSVFTDDVTHYAYDPAKAATLLDEAGWRLSPDGWRRNDKGEALRITLATTAGNTGRELIEQIIQSDWKKIGVDTVIRNEPPRVLFAESLTKRTFRGGAMYAWMSSPRNIPKTTLHSTMIPTDKNNYSGQNYPGYNNRRMDKMIDDMQVVCKPADNLKLWHEMQKQYADQLPALPLYYRAEAYFIPTWLAGVTPTGHQFPSTLWVENWRDTGEETAK